MLAGKVENLCSIKGEALSVRCVVRDIASAQALREEIATLSGRVRRQIVSVDVKSIAARLRLVLYGIHRRICGGLCEMIPGEGVCEAARPFGSKGAECAVTQVRWAEFQLGFYGWVVTVKVEEWAWIVMP